MDDDEWPTEMSYTLADRSCDRLRHDELGLETSWNRSEPCCDGEILLGLVSTRARGYAVRVQEPPPANCQPCPYGNAAGPEQQSYPRGTVEPERRVVSFGSQTLREPEDTRESGVLRIGNESPDSRMTVEGRSSPGSDGDIDRHVGVRRTERSEDGGRHQRVAQAAGFDDENVAHRSACRTRRFRVQESEEDLPFGGEFSVDGGSAGTSSDIATDLTDLNFEPQGIAGANWSLETHPIDASEEGCFVPILRVAEEGNGTDLGQCFDDEYTRHHRISGKVTDEERLVDRHIFDADGALPPFDLDDAIDQEKGIAVRNDLLNLPGFQHAGLLGLDHVRAPAGRQRI
jgi:hypothetical protein